MTAKDIMKFIWLCEKKIKLEDYKYSKELIYLCVNPHYKKVKLNYNNIEKKVYKNTFDDFKFLLKQYHQRQISENKLVEFMNEQDIHSFKAYKYILEKKLTGIYRYNTLEKMLNLQLPIKKPKRNKEFGVIILDNDEKFSYNVGKDCRNIANELLNYISKLTNKTKIGIILDKACKVKEVIYNNNDTNGQKEALKLKELTKRRIK